MDGHLIDRCPIDGHPVNRQNEVLPSVQLVSCNTCEVVTCCASNVARAAFGAADHKRAKALRCEQKWHAVRALRFARGCLQCNRSHAEVVIVTADDDDKADNDAKADDDNKADDDDKADDNNKADDDDKADDDNKADDDANSVYLQQGRVLRNRFRGP